MRSAWRVLGVPKEEIGRVASRDKLDYELLDRWVKFVQKPPQFYPYLKQWQEMIKSGGSEDEAKKLAGEFQELLLEVMFEAREVKEENDIIRAKALPGTRKKEPANLPHEFVTNDDFCPGCGLELKSLAADKMHLWTDVFRRDLRDPTEMVGVGLYEGMRPGLLLFSGWTLERWLGGDRRRYLDDLRTDIEAMKKAVPPK
mgnify:CR=1 FL=1